MTKLINLNVLSRVKENKKGIKFRTFFTKMNIVVVGEEEKGKQEKYVNVKFRKDVKTDIIKRGILTCKIEDVNAPFKYQIIQANDGTLEYPCIWVRGYESYEDTTARHEQNDFIVDEQDTEETDIIDIKDTFEQ